MILQSYDTECSNGPVGARKPILKRTPNSAPIASDGLNAGGTARLGVWQGVPEGVAGFGCEKDSRRRIPALKSVITRLSVSPLSFWESVRDVWGLCLGRASTHSAARVKSGSPRPQG